MQTSKNNCNGYKRHNFLHYTERKFIWLKINSSLDFGWNPIRSSLVCWQHYFCVSFEKLRDRIRYSKSIRTNSWKRGIDPFASFQQDTCVRARQRFSTNVYRWDAKYPKSSSLWDAEAAARSLNYLQRPRAKINPHCLATTREISSDRILQEFDRKRCRDHTVHFLLTNPIITW